MTEPVRPPQPETIRHAVADRLFHRVMAVCVIILGGTAFLPIVGIKFDWVLAHWISGLVLAAAVLFHLWRVFGVHGLSEMLPRRADFNLIGREIFLLNVADRASGKFDVFQKLYHWMVSLVVLALLVTGGVMLAKIDTPFWARDPSILSDWNWGVVYVIHGSTSLILLFLFILHLYFAFLPDHRKLLWSMVFGVGPARAHQPHSEGEQ